MNASKELTSKINQLLSSNIHLTPARFAWHTLSKLPIDLEEILKLLTNEHRELIQENLTGSPTFSQRVPDFDLSKTLRYYDEKNEDAALILGYVKTFFQGRPVDVAQGKGQHKEEYYSLTFDWIVVLDPENKVLYSFILNNEKAPTHAGR